MLTFLGTAAGASLAAVAVLALIVAVAVAVTWVLSKALDLLSGGTPGRFRRQRQAADFAEWETELAADRSEA